MSELPARRMKITFPNPGISPEQWFLDVNSSPWTKFAPMLPMTLGLLFSGVMLAFLITTHEFLQAIKDGSDEVILGIAFWPGIFLGIWLETLITNTVNNKRDAYRREQARLLADALKDQGWIVDSRSTLVNEDFPYLHNNSFRYKTYQRSIKEKMIEWTFDLNDAKAEHLIKEDAKQKQIARMTAEYEKEHGPLSPEKKATFQNALKLTL